ncbi:MAG: hypothetical protein H5U25_02245, partial [Oceanibaculum nanhaiense]|nr:hypothetical protein [Oceanibaculum nanhaiense]
ASIGHFRAAVSRRTKLALTIAGLLLIFNDLRGILVGAAIAALALGGNWLAARRLAEGGKGG